jgi:phosphatidylglycerophosphate synthase
MQSVLGTILDPAADKTLMTTLTVTLAVKGLLPGTLFAFFMRAPPSSVFSRLFKCHWRLSYLVETFFSACRHFISDTPPSLHQ